jgi:type I restriction enzyme M protein
LDQIIIEDNLPTVEAALADLKTAWKESQEAEERFIKILTCFVKSGENKTN